MSKRIFLQLLYKINYTVGVWRKNIANNLSHYIATCAILVIIGLIANHALHPDAAPLWTGFGEYENPTYNVFVRSKNLWDWLELIFVPATLAVGAFFLNYWQTKNSERLSLDNQRQAVLESYFDRMAELVLTYDLHQNNKASSIARTRTLATLRQLDGGRKAQLLQFVQELNLIRTENPLLNLSGADFSEALLIGAELGSAKLNGISFKGANLQDAYMVEANLTGVRFDGANLVNCNFANAILTGAIFERANLKGAIFDGATLKDTNFRYTNASEALIANAQKDTIHEDEQASRRKRKK